LAARMEDLFVPPGVGRNIPVPAAAWGEKRFESGTVEPYA
jgi:hypothetical protein